MFPVRFNACVHGAEVPSCSSLVKSGPKPNLDSFDLAIVRRAIHSMYGQQMPVSLPGLQKWLNIHHPELKPSLSSSSTRGECLIKDSEAKKKIL